MSYCRWSLNLSQDRVNCPIELLQLTLWPRSSETTWPRKRHSHMHKYYTSQSEKDPNLSMELHCFLMMILTVVETITEPNEKHDFFWKTSGIFVDKTMWLYYFDTILSTMEDRSFHDQIFALIRRRGVSKRRLLKYFHDMRFKIFTCV